MAVSLEAGGREEKQDKQEMKAHLASGLAVRENVHDLQAKEKKIFVWQQVKGKKRWPGEMATIPGI